MDSVPVEGRAPGAIIDITCEFAQLTFVPLPPGHHLEVLDEDGSMVAVPDGHVVVRDSDGNLSAVRADVQHDNDFILSDDKR